MSRLEHFAHLPSSPDRLRVREAHDRSWASWLGAVRRVDSAAAEGEIRPVRVRSSDPERSSPLPGIATREKVQRELFDE